MKSLRPQSLIHRRSIARCLLLSFFFALLPLATHGKVRRASSRAGATPQDTPPGFFPGLIHYFAGNGNDSGTYSDGSLPTNVSILPQTLAADSLGNVYIGTGSGSIYMVFAGGSVPASLANVTTNAPTPVQPIAGRIYQVAGLTGSSCTSDPDPTCGEGMPLNKAAFGAISSIAFDSANDLFISDGGSYVIREVAAQTSKVTTIAGTLNVSNYTGDGGPANQATLSGPSAIALDSSANVYIVDYSALRVVYSGSAPPAILAAEGIPGAAAQPGAINTFAGQDGVFCYVTPSSGSPGAPGGCGDYGPANGTAAVLVGPNSIAVDPAGNVYLMDAFADAIYPPEIAYMRIIYATGTVPPLLDLALNPTGGSAITPTGGYIYAVTGYDPSVLFAPCAAAPCGDGGLPADVQFGANGDSGIVMSILVDSLNNVYIADSGDYAIREIDTALIASTIAGVNNPAPTNPPSAAPAPGGPATSTRLSNDLSSIAFDPSNNLYIGDVGFDLVWVVAPLLPQTITIPASDTVTYGTSSVALTATANSGLPVSYSITSTPANIAALNGSSLVITGAGTVVITATQAGNAQYGAATPVTETLTIDPALLTVKAVNASALHGQTPTYMASYSGFVGSDTSANSVTGTPAFSPTAIAAASLAVGTYPLTISPGSLASTNYTFAFVQGATLTITGATSQTITFPQPPDITYGQSATVTLSATSTSGLAVQYTVVSGPATDAMNGAVLAITGGGTVVVTASQPGNSQYAAAPPVTLSFKVAPAPLTVTGPIVTLAYGTAINPSSFPAATITGLIGSNNSSLLTGSAQYATATGTPNAGTYPITVTQGTLALVPSAAASYVLSTYVNGQLTITAQSQTINLNPVSAAQTYGTLFPLVATATSGLPVAYALTGPGYFYNGITSGNFVQVVPTGVGAITVTATQPGSTNVGAAPPVTQVFTIGPAPLDIGIAQTYSVQQGAAFPAFQPAFLVAAGQPGGFLNSDADVPAVITGAPVITTIATPSSAPGTYAITPTRGTLAAPNYYFVFVPGTLILTPPGAFTITSSPASLIIPAGLSAQATLTVNPTTSYTDASGNHQISLYQGTVTLSCGALPANVTCTISPSTYTFPGNQAGPNQGPFENSAQGTITIAASGATVVGSVRNDNSISRAMTFLIPGALAGLLLAFARKRATRYSRMWGAVLFLALGAGLLGISSCGGSSHSLTAAPGTTTVMVNGSGTTVTGNGSVSATLPLTVVIQ